MIYTSLLALDHDPSLWDRFHDDNLILTKADFVDPARSRLIKLMRQQGGEVARLTDALATATRSLATMPALTNLVQVKRSKLPDWMRPSTVVTVQTKTREASPAVPVSSQPTGAQAAGRTTIPGGPQGATQSPPTISAPSTAASREWVGVGLKRGLRLAVSVWWIGLIGSPILLGIAQGIGAAQGKGAAPSDSWFVAILLYFAGILCLGLVLEGIRSNEPRP